MTLLDRLKKEMKKGMAIPLAITLVLGSGCIRRPTLNPPKIEPTTQTQMQDAFCETHYNYAQGTYKVYFYAVYHPLTEENRAKSPEWEFLYSHTSSNQEAKRDVEECNALAKERLAEYQALARNFTLNQ